MKMFGTAAILAGGKSSRMGFDKQLLTLDGKRFHVQIIEQLRQLFGDVLLVTNKPEFYRELPVRVCSDVFPGRGPLGGIHAALFNAQSRYVYVLACDMPCVCPGYIHYQMKLLRRNPSGACVTRKEDWLEPFNAFYSTDTLPILSRHLQEGKSSLYFFLKEINAAILAEETARRFDPEMNMFLNLNTPAEYEAFIKRRGRYEACG
ncbi:MAG: molybdenum cofactor guanylyltransferase [bacterium]|jgi:molybdopterin-guanine dinucleotide biosynthesis protein A